MFALNGVLKAYAGRPALGPLTLTVLPGRTTVLIGPSGCGKSIFLRLLIGLVGAERRRGTTFFTASRLPRPLFGPCGCGLDTLTQGELPTSSAGWTKRWCW